jgi:hypothetical protein
MPSAGVNLNRTVILNSSVCSNVPYNVPYEVVENDVEDKENNYTR